MNQVYVLFRLKANNETTIKVYADIETAYKGLEVIVREYSSFIRIRKLLAQKDYIEILKIWSEFTSEQEILTLTQQEILT
jgi:hypothetical protein